MDNREIWENESKVGILLFCAVSIFCCAALTVRQSFADGHLISSDSVGWFSFLVALVNDQTLNYGDILAVFGRQETHAPVGTALAWLPFYLFGRLVSLTTAGVFGLPIVNDRIRGATRLLRRGYRLRRGRGRPLIPVGVPVVCSPLGPAGCRLTFFRQQPSELRPGRALHDSFRQRVSDLSSFMDRDEGRAAGAQGWRDDWYGGWTRRTYPTYRWTLRCASVSLASSERAKSKEPDSAAFRGSIGLDDDILVSAVGLG